MPDLQLPNYRLLTGSTLDRAMLVKFMQRTYEELFPGTQLSHLASTVEQYFSRETPLWWVEQVQPSADLGDQPSHPRSVACLWVGNAIDQTSGDRHAHIFLLYVAPEHRRQGIGSALVQYAENWAKARGDRQIGLQVFESNQAAFTLYQGLGYQIQSLSMVKPLQE